ncbi:MAG: Zn-dependent oligopeptidase [Bacteroidetes bacterium]|nr:Zn-dependent oligopeptidase [Bacteroidota bacterium]
MIKNNSMPFLIGISSSKEFSAKHENHLREAQELLTQLLSVEEKRTVENTLQPYDEILLHLDAVGNQSSLLENVHTDAEFRSAAELFSQKAAAFGAELSLHRGVYDALSSMDISGADEKTKFYVEKTLRDFRLSGVDKDEETRKKIKALRDELILIGQDFSRNIREDVRTVIVNDAGELDGLPQDYIARHKPNEKGEIVLTINYPDAVPVFTYAKSESLRKRMYMEYNNRAYPKNMEVLNKLIAKRYELAQILGFPNWAAFVTADKMVGSEQRASEFIDTIAGASLEKSQRDYQQLLATKQKELPDASEIHPWESGYYSELLRKRDYAFDAQSVRPYFQYARVKEGVLTITSRLFGVEFRKNSEIPVWHPSVECYEMFEDRMLAGRFYFDMHPRENKYNHAAQFGICNGVQNKQIPEAALICNFPGGDDHDPGLMEHRDVETFFHEFGHLLHHLFGGRQPWIGISGISCEWDFVEVPSQLLEEWAWDAATLQTFAKHFQTNEPIPAFLVEQMHRAEEFGKGLQVRQQMMYAQLSLSCFNTQPEKIDTDALVKTLREKYTPYKFVEGTHMQTSFGHLDGYSAIYYTYMWSLVIAKDFFSLFDKKDLLDTPLAATYRKKILAEGGAKPAAEMVRSFLGRDFQFNGWKEWLEN